MNEYPIYLYQNANAKGKLFVSQSSIDNEIGTEK